MDWILNKTQLLRKHLPDNVNIMLNTIFDFIRCQRNDLGHPQQTPPNVTRDDAFVNLRIFPNYYKMVNQVIDYLNKNSI